MEINEAIKKRILELVEANDTTITNLCLNSRLTPSTVFDFLYGKSKNPNIRTIQKLCIGSNITLQEFFSRDYFNVEEE